MAFFVFSPWLLKNLLFIGSPIYPLFFPAGDMDALRQQMYSRPELAERNPLWAGLIFFRAVFGGVQGANEYDATLNPLLAFLPLALAVGWRWLESNIRRELGLIVVFVLAAYAAWCALTLVTPLAEQARLFFALFPAIAILAVGGFAALRALDTPALRPSFIVSAGLVLVFGLSLFEYTAEFSRHNPLAYLLGQQSADDYRRDNLGWYVVAIEKVNGLPADSRVLFLWEARSLECAAPERCAPDVIIDRWWHLRRSVGASDLILARWKEQGFTHLLVYEVGLDFIRNQPNNGYVEADWVELESLQAQLRLIDNLDGAYTLYEMP